MKKINNSRHENYKECHPVLKTYCKSAIISCISNFVYQKNFRLVEVLACSLVDFSLTESSPDWDYIQDYGY